MTWPNPEPQYKAFNEAVKDLQGESMVELQRLASEMPDHLIVSYLTIAPICVLADRELGCLRSNITPRQRNVVIWHT
jgi:hypothetical protein